MIALLARLLPLFAPKEQRQLFNNLKLIWNLPQQSAFAKMFAHQVWKNQIRTLCLTTKWALSRELPDIQDSEDFFSAVRAFDGQKIFITAHLGAWEISGALATKSSPGSPVSVLAKKPAKSHPFLSRMLSHVIEKLRQGLGLRPLWVDGAESLRPVLEALKKGESLGFVMDQKPEGRRGPQVKFFGIETAFVGGPAAFALKYELPIIGVFCVWRAGKLAVEWNVLTPAAGETVDHLTQRLATLIEEKIRLYPEQWTWSYKKWKM